MPHYIKVSQTASTNTYLSRLAATLPGGTVIDTPCQTAGRGQKGNSFFPSCSSARPSRHVTSSI